MKKLFTLFATVLLSALSLTASAATAEVYIDKPEAVMFYVFADDWDLRQLPNSGDTPNLVEFDEAKTKLFEFDPYNLNTGIYKITKNDQEVMVFNGEGYEVADVKDGDVIRVTVERPAGAVTDCTYTIVSGAEAIASVENADTYEFYTVTAGVFEAVAGDRIVLRPSTDYVVTSVTLDDEEMQYIPGSGCYFFMATAGAHTIAVTAGTPASATRTVTVDSNNLASLDFYATDFYFFLGDPIAIDGNQLTLSTSTPYLQVKAADGYKVTDANFTTNKGRTGTLTYDSYLDAYYIDVVANDVASITINTEENVPQFITATVWVEDVSRLSYYFIRTKDRQFPFHSSNEPLLQTGDNTLTISADQSPIRLCMEFVESPVCEVFLNDQPLSAVTIDPDDQSVWGDFAIADGDVLKIYTTVGGPTSIAGPQLDQPRKVHTLQGVEVSRPTQPGIYIVGGKKVVVR